jgi:hypothetical protein
LPLLVVSVHALKPLVDDRNEEKIAKLAARRNSRYLIKRVRFSPVRALFRNFKTEEL